MCRSRSSSAVREVPIMAAAAALAEEASVTAAPASGAGSSGESPAVEGEGVGAAGREQAAEAAGDSEEDGEDVFEVERILDMKTEGVRGRGRASRVRARGGGRRGGSRCGGGVRAARAPSARGFATVVGVEVGGGAGAQAGER